MEPFLVILSPEPEEEDHSSHDGQEFIFVLSGRMKAEVGDKVEILHPGDSIYYESKIPHVVSCDSEEPTTILAVLYDES
jgi:quercetin dioxygenase-like cupin family protein